MNADERRAGSPTPNAQSPEFALSDFSLPKVTVTEPDGKKFEYNVIWMDPVHRGCRVILGDGVEAYAAKLEAKGNLTALAQLKDALEIIIPPIAMPGRDLRRN